MEYLFRELAQQKENLEKSTAEFERTTVAYELIKRSVDDSNIYKDVYAMEKRVESARQQVKRSILSKRENFIELFRFSTNKRKTN